MMLLGGNLSPSPQQWALLICLAGAALIYYAWRRRGSPPWGRITGREEVIDPRVDSLRDDLSRLLKELEELSARLDQQLAVRHQSVQEAIRDADQRIKALRLLVHAACVKNGGHPGDTPDMRTRRIYELADRGLSATEIARRLEEPAGEVDLILNLRTEAERNEHA
jgi:hypothetical protein